MGSFINFITEAKGADTAFSGHANEHFTNDFLNAYQHHHDDAVKRGIANPHEHALRKMNAIKYDHAAYSQHPELANAAKHFGPQEMENIHNDSKMTANGIINHLRNKYGQNVAESIHVGKGGPAMVEKLTGKPSQADIVVRTNQNKTAPIVTEHKGVSLKYSKVGSGSTKIHSPTLKNMADIIEAHHEKLHGKSFGLHALLKKEADRGLREQRQALRPYHDIIMKHLDANRDPNDKKLKHLTYKKNAEGDLELHKDAISHIRDSDDPRVREAYDAMATANLAMKARMAHHFHSAVASAMGAPSNPKNNQTKESLFRSIANVQRPEESKQLPTMLVSTERGKGTTIHDVNDYIKNHIDEHGVEETSHNEGTGGFKVGPLSLNIDTRPTTNRNPVTSFPINTNISNSELKKNTEKSNQKDAAAAETKTEVKPVVKKKKVEVAPTPVEEKRKKQTASSTIGDKSFYSPSEIGRHSDDGGKAVDESKKSSGLGFKKLLEMIGR